MSKKFTIALTIINEIIFTKLFNSLLFFKVINSVKKIRIKLIIMNNNNKYAKILCKSNL